MNNIKSGDLLIKNNEGYCNSNKDLVLKFSKKFIEKLKAQEKKVYLNCRPISVSNTALFRQKSWSMLHSRRALLRSLSRISIQPLMAGIS